MCIRDSSCNTRSRRAWASSGSSPISSRNRVPPSAASTSPARPALAPVKAPFSWPNSSDSIRVSGIAAQFTEISGALARFDRLCRARATSSLPVPDSPWISTVAVSYTHLVGDADGHGDRQADGRPQRVAAADPVPHGEDVFLADAEGDRGFLVAGDGDEMAVKLFLGAALGQVPGCLLYTSRPGPRAGRCRGY